MGYRDVFYCDGDLGHAGQLDQVTTGQGKVVPSSQDQIVQYLEGGIVKNVLVSEGQQVVKGQPLIHIDDTQFLSSFNEHSRDVSNSRADVIRLTALLDSVRLVTKAGNRDVTVESVTLDFDNALREANPALVTRQTREYHDALSNVRNQLEVMAGQVRQKQRELKELNVRISNQQQSFNLARKEYNITKPLADEGVVTRLEFLRLERQLNEARKELNASQLQKPILEGAIEEARLRYLDVALTFRDETQNRLNETSARLAVLSESSGSLRDKVSRTTVTSPVTGTVQKLFVNTIGGVIKPGMDIVKIVPTEDTLLIEARIAPKDIAFLRPGLNVLVKFSAYDFLRFGGLNGKLEHISADTLQDKEGNSYYLARVRTELSSLSTPGGERLPIIPGMQATADIITGKRTMMDYLLNPILTAKHVALRE